MKSTASASIDLLILLIEYVTARGVTPERLTASKRFEAELLNDREARIPFEQYQDLFVRAAGECRDEYFGLHFGEAARHFPPGHLLSAVMNNSATTADALDRFFRYHSLMCDAVSPRLERTGEQARIIIEPIVPGLQIDRHYADASLCICTTFARKLSSKRINPIEVRFSHATPRSTTEHQRIFACRLRFEQPMNELRFELRQLELALPHADYELLASVERMAQKRLARSAPRSVWTSRTERSILRTLLAGKKPQTKLVALDLAVSVRNLQVKLAEEGTSYKQVLDDVRFALAKDYLKKEDLSLCEVAFLLGFSEQSTFTHAFKRWTGCTPIKYRS